MSLTRRRAMVGAAVLALASSCSSSGGPIGGSGGHGGTGGTAQCAQGGASGEPDQEQIVAGDSLPVDQYRHAMAVARCAFWGRCSNLAPYVVNQCIDALTANVPWTYQQCAGTPASSGCATVTTRYKYPTPELLRGVADGTVHYDPGAAARCIDVLLGQACVYVDLIEWIPACAQVFTCPTASSAAGGAGGGADGTAGAGGAGGVGNGGGMGGAGGAGGADACPALLDPTPLYDVCQTDADCAGVTINGDATYCLDGFCTNSPCRLFDSQCESFVEAGGDCVLGGPGLATYSASVLPGTCAPGLACAGVVPAVRDGTCVVPQDVGAACTTNDGCLRGLACLCGVCQLSPTSGPCAVAQCRIGPAYCDFSDLTCKPTRGSGGSCSDAINACAPNLVCDKTASVCEVPTP